MKLPIISRMFNRMKQSPVAATRALGVTMTPAGIRMDHDIALTYHAVWAAVRCIAETLGVLNMHVFQNLPNGGTKRRSDLKLDALLRRAPNKFMSAMTFREILVGHALTWGNGYAEIEWDQAQRPIALWPILPHQMRPVIIDDELFYEFRSSKGEVYYVERDSIFHLKGFGFDGLMGYDVISYFANTIGHAIAVETFSSSYFGNGTHLSGGLFAKRRLSAEARNSLREEFVAAYSGPRKAFRMGVFEEGLEWKPFGLSPEASKLIESRQVSVEDVARIFRVPQHKIGHLLRSTNNNIEHQGIEYVVDTILPWATRIEQEADTKLLSKALQRDHYTKLNVATLMRGDMKSRYEAYKIGREWGWLNANQIAELEDMNPIGEAGDVYIVPLNYQSIDALLLPPEPPQTSSASQSSPDSSGPDPAELSTRPANRLLIKRTMEKVFRREFAAMKEARKSDDVPKAMATFVESHTKYARENLTPYSEAFMIEFGIDNEADGCVDADMIRMRLGQWFSNFARSRRVAWESIGDTLVENFNDHAKVYVEKEVDAFIGLSIGLCVKYGKGEGK